MLVRHAVSRRLSAYYAQSAQAVVGSTTVTTTNTESRPLPFGSLCGEWHWKRVYGRLYQQQKGQWLTPVELFQPYYSNTVANYVAAAVGKSNDNANDDRVVVDVLELGGGRGTNARFVLDHLEKTETALYERIRYTIIDSSPTLVELQSNLLLDASRCRHADKIRIEKKDLLDVAEGRESLFPETSSANTTSHPTVVIALELLDNLPHDKVRLRSGGVLEEAHVDHVDFVIDEQSSAKEIFLPLSDPLLKEVLEIVPAYYKGGRNVVATWVPTVACGLVLRLAKERPQAQLLVADFDWLPPPDISSPPPPPPPVGSYRQYQYKPARGEPLVTSMDDVDYECYLHAPEFCDVLFPTDFSKLATLVQKVYNHDKNKTTNMEIKVQKQADFLLEYGPEQIQPTKSWLTGYSPLIHDFSNCSVLKTTTTTAGTSF